MRNPFRRQTETTTPSLRERAADLRANLRPRHTAPASMPAPGSAEARAAWEDTCREHSKRTQALPRHPELVRSEGGVWTTDTLSKALDFGTIKPAEFARLYPLASEFALGLEQIGHDLNVHALFALAHATEFPKEGEAVPAATAEDTFAPVPASLADACRWAVRHRAWVDQALKVTDWSDDKFNAETGKTNAAISRAINEPSTHLAEIVAKAVLALDDFERFTMAFPREPDDGARIVHTVLREIAGLRSEAAPAPDCPSDLPVAIFDAWAAWGATLDQHDAEGEKAWEQASAEMNRLCDFAADLPVTRENIQAKTLAAAWIGWVFAERRDHSRSEYATDERCLFDINAAITAAHRIRS